MLYVYLGVEEREDSEETLKTFELPTHHCALTDPVAEYVHVKDLYDTARKCYHTTTGQHDALKDAQMAVYLAQGDIWVNCGSTRPKEELRFPKWDFLVLNPDTRCSELVGCHTDSGFPSEVLVFGHREETVELRLRQRHRRVLRRRRTQKEEEASEEHPRNHRTRVSVETPHRGCQRDRTERGDKVPTEGSG